MNSKRTLLNLALSLVTSTALLTLLTGFVPDGEERQIRRSVDTVPLTLRPQDMPPALPENKEGGGGWFYREMISREVRGAVYGTTGAAAGGLLAFTEDGVALLTVAGPRELRPPAIRNSAHALQPLAYTDDAALAATALPVSYGEALDAAGRPLRLLAANNPADAAQQLCPLPRDFIPGPASRFEKIAESPYIAEDLFSRAQRYKNLVEQFAERFRINTELVYAIIHNESNFRPETVSSRQAMGLMQLLPSTAGGEVHKFLHGANGELDDADLIKPETNLRYGIAYLHLLLNRHFGDVTDPASRELCAIAAYNLGPNGLLNTFSRDREEAVTLINRMSPQELYSRLSEDLPVRETRNFLARVINSKKEFVEFQ